MRNTSTETNSYDNLFAGEVAEPISINIADSQTIKRGDLLECAVTETYAAGPPPTVTRAVAASFAKAAAVADIKNIYVIAADDITTGDGETTKKIAAYRSGNFDSTKIGLGGSSTVADNYTTLLAKGIVLKTAQSN